VFPAVLVVLFVVNIAFLVRRRAVRAVAAIVTGSQE
jgi:hypothetical protein